MPAEEPKPSKVAERLGSAASGEISKLQPRGRGDQNGGREKEGRRDERDLPSRFFLSSSTSLLQRFDLFLLFKTSSFLSKKTKTKQAASPARWSRSACSPSTCSARACRPTPRRGGCRVLSGLCGPCSSRRGQSKEFFFPFFFLFFRSPSFFLLTSSLPPPV